MAAEIDRSVGIDTGVFLAGTAEPACGFDHLESRLRPVKVFRSRTRQTALNKCALFHCKRGRVILSKI